MYLLTLCIILLSTRVYCESEELQELQYEFPEVSIEALRPRGLSVSIPDSPGVQLFAFHGNINKPLNNIDAGDLSKDIVKRKGDRWVYENQNVALRKGDVLYFWLFVIKNNLGYRLDNQSYTIKGIQDTAKPTVPTKRPDVRPTRPRPPKPQRPQSSPHDTGCDCATYCQQLSVNITEKCNSTPVPIITSTTETPAKMTPSTIDTIVHIWSESLNNATEEKKNLIWQNEYLSNLTEHLIKVVKTFNSPDINKIKMTGRIPSDIDEDIFVINLFKEKLQVRNRPKNIVREDNAIIIEMADYRAKLNVLQAAKEKLANSRIMIRDLMLDVKFDLDMRQAPTKN